ncbi:MAG: hypothetical protein ABJD70_13450 [Halioglobus sp.]
MAQSKKPLAAALGAAFLATSIAPLVSAEVNPFSAQQLSGGYDLANFAHHGEKADKEGKCGEGKCGDAKKGEGEGKCGEGKCGDAKKGEGEGKCGEGKCGDAKKGEGEGKCGEGKCGG